MKRDWDFIRDLLIDIENETDTVKKHDKTENEEKFLVHIRMLTEQGFVNDIQAKQGLNGQWYISKGKPHLSWSGHDLLETIRSKSVWEKVKDKSKETGIELTTDTVKTLAAWAVRSFFPELAPSA